MQEGQGQHVHRAAIGAAGGEEAAGGAKAVEAPAPGAQGGGGGELGETLEKTPVVQGPELIGGALGEPD